MVIMKQWLLNKKLSVCKEQSSGQICRNMWEITAIFWLWKGFSRKVENFKPSFKKTSRPQLEFLFCFSLFMLTYCCILTFTFSRVSTSCFQNFFFPVSSVSFHSSVHLTPLPFVVFPTGSCFALEIYTLQCNKKLSFWVRMVPKNPLQCLCVLYVSMNM